VVPSVGLPHQHLPGVRWEADAVVAEVEPSFPPIRIVGGHGARRVQLLARIPQCEHQATGANRLKCSRLARGESMKLLTVDFGTPSYEFTVNICTYLIF
jgi:hypothetical protein